jgi:hypothetical protein
MRHGLGDESIGKKYGPELRRKRRKGTVCQVAKLIPDLLHHIDMHEPLATNCGVAGVERLWEIAQLQ